MYFSAKELHNFYTKCYPYDYRLEEYKRYSKETEVTLAGVTKFLSAVKDSIVRREPYVGTYSEGNEVGLQKWLRPWVVVDLMPEAEEGDYIIGVEVEMGFVDDEAARFIAESVQNWDYITLDFEGGDYPIEATFPPMNYKNFDGRCQVQKYIKLLADNQELVYEHDSDEEHVGTHVNVSRKGRILSPNRAYSVAEILEEHLDYDDKEYYFGRHDPYGYIYIQGDPRVADEGYLEFKLFNSTTDLEQFRRYVHIAVTLTELISGEEEITESSVRAALESGYNHA